MAPRTAGRAPLATLSTRFAEDDNRLAVTAPADGATVTAGGTLSLRLSVADTTGFRSAAVFFGDDVFTTTTRASVLAFDLPVSGAVLDSVEVTVVATFEYPDSTIVATALRRVYVEPGASPLALDAGGVVREVVVGDAVRPRFEATFPTFLSRPGGGALTASISNPSVVAFNPSTQAFTALAEGSALVIVSYRGAQDTLRFAVGAAPLPPLGVTAEIRVLLSGAYVDGSMTSPLAADGVMPEAQPFAASLYDGTALDYDGADAVAPGFFASRTDVVDWVLIELRTTPDGSPIWRGPALLLASGLLAGTDGTTPMALPGLAAGAYHVVVRHRNHLPVMSAAPVDLSSGSAAYDFTSAQAQAYSAGGVAMIGLGTGGTAPFALFSGDADVDGRILSSDYQQRWRPQNGQEGYLSADFDLDGRVLSSDYQQQWRRNTGVAESQVPEPAATRSRTTAAVEAATLVPPPSKPEPVRDVAPQSRRSIRVEQPDVPSRPAAPITP